MMYGSWDIRYGKQSFSSFWVIFCPLTILTTWKIKILKKWKKHLKILSFYTCIPQMMIWCMVPEIWSTTNRIFCHFGLFFAHLPPPSPPPPTSHLNNPENQNFAKMKKKRPEDIITLHICAIMKIIWCMFLEIWSMTDVTSHFGPFFTLLSPLTTQKIKIFKKRKKHL